MIISQHAGKIAALNDKLRTTLDPNSGQAMLTQGVTSLVNAFVQAALAEVKAFNVFIEDNDPHGEHDFGSFEIDGRKLFFKIDYYHKDMRYGSEDPSGSIADRARSHAHARRGVLSDARQSQAYVRAPKLDGRKESKGLVHPAHRT
jgi:hypothetical protein